MANLVAGGPVPGTAASRSLGVAPGATVVVVRVAREDGTTSLSSVLAGLDWVATHPDQVDVANLSLSYDRPGDAYGADPLTEAVDAVRDAGVARGRRGRQRPRRRRRPGLHPLRADRRLGRHPRPRRPS